MSSRRFSVMICFLGLSVPACVRHQTPLGHQSRGKQAYREQEPARLEPYIRTIFRISQQNRAELQQDRLEQDLGDPSMIEARAEAENAPEDPVAAKRLIETLFRAGRRLEALDQALALRARLGDDPELILLLARIWTHFEHLPEAVKTVHEAVRLAPLSADAWTLLAEVESIRGRDRKAAEAFREAIRLGAEGTGALKSAGALFLQMQWWREARDCLSRVWEKGDRSPETAEGLAAAWLHLDREAAALESLLRVHPPARAWTRLGRLWLADKQWERARNAFVQALDLEPSQTEARLLQQMADSYLPPPRIVKLGAFGRNPVAQVQLPAKPDAGPVQADLSGLDAVARRFQEASPEDATSAAGWTAVSGAGVEPRERRLPLPRAPWRLPPVEKWSDAAAGLINARIAADRSLREAGVAPVLPKFRVGAAALWSDGVHPSAGGKVKRTGLVLLPVGWEAVQPLRPARITAALSPTPENGTLDAALPPPSKPWAPPSSQGAVKAAAVRNSEQSVPAWSGRRFAPSSSIRRSNPATAISFTGYAGKPRARFPEIRGPVSEGVISPGARAAGVTVPSSMMGAGTCLALGILLGLLAGGPAGASVGAVLGLTSGLTAWILVLPLG